MKRYDYGIKNQRSTGKLTSQQCCEVGFPIVIFQMSSFFNKLLDNYTIFAYAIII